MAAVLVHIDLDGDAPHASSLVALGAGRQLCSSWGATLYAAVVVHDPTGVTRSAGDRSVDALTTSLSLAGADRVVIALNESPVAPLWACIGSAWQGVLDRLRPRVVLFGADAPSAIELGPRTGARIGARLLVRARTSGNDADVELRDRDGGGMRLADMGAAVALVALIGRADRPTTRAHQRDAIDVVVLAPPTDPDRRIEVGTTTPAGLPHEVCPIVVLGEDVAEDDEVIADATRLAALLGGRIVTDRSSPIASQLCVVIGSAKLDISGATSVIKVGAPGDRSADGTISGSAKVGVAELVRRLESM